jgi:hypothetical protein
MHNGIIKLFLEKTSDYRKCPNNGFYLAPMGASGGLHGGRGSG